jgi:gamma-butyrobetaine dioxygenase
MTHDVSMTTDPVSWLRDTFAGQGGQDYLGEPVTIAQHMLQCAGLARAAAAPDHLVVAALVHDVGHFVGLVSGADLMSGTDNRHDESGAAWLSQWFGPEVTEPVRLHVAAKRYLCAIDPEYVGALSEASVFTLAVQGGPMAPAEVAAFEALPYAADAVTVRRFDDAAKDPAARTPAFAEFIPAITAARLRPEPPISWFARHTGGAPA